MKRHEHIIIVGAHVRNLAGIGSNLLIAYRLECENDKLVSDGHAAWHIGTMKLER